MMTITIRLIVMIAQTTIKLIQAMDIIIHTITIMSLIKTIIRLKPIIVKEFNKTIAPITI